MKGIGAVIVAAGRGSRMKSGTGKQFLELCGHPLGYWCLRALEPFVDEMVLVCPPGEEERTLETLTDGGAVSGVRAVAGGAERSDSVRNGLAALSDDCEYVLIQDAARPCLREETVEAVIRAVKECGACIAGVPVVCTLKKADDHGVITETVDRTSLWEAQTPQAFSLPLIRKAYETMEACPDREPVTDDASVVEQYAGHPVRMVEAFRDNIKVTVPEDLETAAYYLERLGKA